MANYTVELRHVVEAPTNIFNFQYDFFTDDLTGLPAEIYTITKNKLTKEKFQQHFIDHFYFYEIGQETVGKFIHYLKVTFHEKLPYYNMLFTSALMDYAILYNYNLDETSTRTTTNDLTNTGTVSNVTHSDTVTNQDTTTTENNTLITDTDETRSHNDDITLTKKHHDTPTGAVPTDLSIYVSSVDLDTNVSTITETNGNISTVDDDKHITGTNDMSVTDDNTLTGETTNKNTGTVTETYTHNTRGDVGVSSQMKAIQEHIDLQKTFTTIESKFFDECNDLFMQIL